MQFIFNVVIAIISIFLYKKNRKGYNKAIDLACIEIFKYIDDIAKIKINKIYEQAYKVKNAEQYVKKEFDKVLQLKISYLISRIDEAYECDTVDDLCNVITNTNIEDLKHTQIEIINESNKYDTTIRYLQRYAITYKKICGDTQFDSYFRLLLNRLEKIISNNICRDYLFYIFKNMISKGCSFKKNDILDWMIISFTFENDLIITFDKNIINFIKEKKDCYSNLKSSLELIQNCRF